MTKERAPLSIDGALARIAGKLPGGWAQMAAITGYHERTVRAWGDGDREEQINIPAAIALDNGYQAAGGAGRPIYDAYGCLVGAAERDRFAEPFDILRHAVDVARESGQANSALLEAAMPDATDADRREAQQELIEAIEAMKIALLRLNPPHIDVPP